MQRSFLKYASAVALAARVVFAQAPSTNPQPGATNFQEKQLHLEHITPALDLTDAQKEQARTILQDAWESSQLVWQEVKQNRERLTAAAKSASEADIQKLASEQGRLIGQLVAIRTLASAKFYQILTPEQRVKADQMHEQFHSEERKNGP